MLIELIRKSYVLLNLNITKEPGNLHNTTRRILLYGRVVGLLPLLGLTSQTSNKLRFTLRSPYTIYYALSLFGQVFMFLATWDSLFRGDISPNNLRSLSFYTATLTTFLLVTKTSWCWPLLMKTVVEKENQLPSFRKNYNTVIHIVLAFIMTAGAVEEILYTTYRFIRLFSCTSQNLTENYFSVNSERYFDYRPDAIWQGIFIEIFRIQAGILWNYNDWLMTVLSLYLAEHFVVHNKRLKKAIQQKKFSCVSKYRLEYLKIVQLVKLINVRFEIFLMISVGTNLLWICIQLFSVLNADFYSSEMFIVCEFENPASMLFLRRFYLTYFIFSLCYVVIRSLLVLESAARIQSNALVMVFTLYDSPSSKFTVEVQRYISQIKNIKIGLHGMHFFLVTRNMILSILGSVVTYELVLFQLAE